MMRIAYRSAFIPPEWLVAHGGEPLRVLPAASTAAGVIPPAMGVCPYMRCYVNTVCAMPDLAAVILATTCDQMRRAQDYLRSRPPMQSFLFNMPATWQTPAAFNLYLAELQRLGLFLRELGGATPDAALLWDVMRQYDAARKQAAPPSTAQQVAGAIPVGLLGGPLAAGDRRLYEAITQAGGVVVLDGTETGQRLQPLALDRRAGGGADPLRTLALNYFAMPDVFQRPNTGLYRWLQAALRQQPLKGLILVRQLWCDLWHAEVARLKEWVRLPLLDLDFDGTTPYARISGRVQAFLEQLR